MGFNAGLRRNEGMYYIKASEGLDSLRTDLGIGPKADIAQNLRFSTEVGAVSKRSAVSYVNIPDIEAYPPQSIYRYYRQDNNTAYIIGLFNTDLLVSTGADFGMLSPTLLINSGGRKFTAVTYQNLCIISTGYDNIVQTDGEVAWELGSCKVVTNADVTGAQVPAGAHSYQCTIVTGNGEIINGALSNSVTNDGTHTSNTLTNIPLGPDGTLSRKIYRTDGGAYKLIATLNTVDTTYVDKIAAGGADIGSVNSDMPRGKYLYVAQERLYVGCDVTAGVGRQSTVYYSDQYIPAFLNTESPDMSTTQAANNFEIINPGDNDIITGLISQLGVTYVFKQNSIIPWDVAGTPEVWTVGTLVSIIGCPAPYTIQNSPQGIIYQGWDRMYLFNGQYSINIIDDFSFDENFLDSSRNSNVGFFWNNLYLLAYSDANEGKDYTNRVLIYDIIRKQTSIDKGGPLVTGGSMNVGSFTASRISGEWGTLYAGDSVLGWVYQYDRTMAINQVNTQSAFNLGTFAGTYAAPPENNTELGGVILDNMEAYTNDTLAQDAWVTSEPDGQYPPFLGTGSDGNVTVSLWSSATSYVVGDIVYNSTDAITYVCTADNINVTPPNVNFWSVFSSVLNCTNLTVSAGATLNATGLPVYCLGTVTINGTFLCSALYSNVVTIGAAGKLHNCATVKCHTLNNAGSMNTDIKSTGSFTTDSSGAWTKLSFFEGGAAGSGSAIIDDEFNMAHGGIGPATATAGWSFLSSVNLLQVKWGEFTMQTIGVPGGSAAGQLYLNVAGAWTLIDSVSANGPERTISTGWTNVTAARIVASVNATGGGSVYANIYGLVLNAVPSCYYVTSTGTVPVSGDISDFVPALQVYSDSTITNQGTYSLNAVCMANLASPTIAKTLPQAFDLTGNSTILIDVWSSRSGTNVQFGLGNTTALSYVNIPVVNAETWVTHELPLGAIVRNAIQYIGMKFTDTTQPNILYIDNIRPSSYTVTPIVYTSSAFVINAESFGSIYWNQVLTSAGTINVYTRTSSDGIAWTAWSAPLTNPAGSVITSIPDIYFQFKVEFSSSDVTGILFPYIYNADGYNIKFTYWKVSTTAETSVEFIYRTGWRNFDQPFDDKIYRKLITLHEATQGYFTATLECDENNTQTTFNNNKPYPSVLSPSPFENVSLVQYPNRWYTTLPDYTYGKELRLTIYKNDNFDYRLRQYAVMLETMSLI